MIFLTGSSGFVGKAIYEELLKNNYDVTRVLSPGKKKKDQRQTIEYQDFLDSNYSKKNLKELVFIHCGWQGVAGDERNDLSQFDNISDTVALFDVALDKSFSHFIFIGSQAEYLETSGLITEKTEMCPNTRYGLAKALTFKNLEYLQKLKHKNILTHAILFDVYGPSDKLNWLIPSLIHKLRADEEVSLTSCEQIWNYLHVADLTSAILELVNCGPVGIVNVCSDHNRPLKDFVYKIAEKLQKQELLKFNSISHHSAKRSIMGCNKKLKDLTNWREVTDFDTGVDDLLKKVVSDEKR